MDEYGECAALGEVLESRGNIGKKQTLFEEYRAEYSRRTAFHSELTAFGFRKKR